MGVLGTALAIGSVLRKGSKTSGVKSDSFDESLERFKGTQYEQMASSNPYENYDYTNSLWDYLGDTFGFRTAQDKHREDMALASREYISQLDSLKREEEYNSESAKVARMRQAGLNPDLQGLENASNASEFTEPETSPSSPEGGEGAALISGVGSLINQVATIGNFFLTLEHSRLVNEGLQLENAFNLVDLVNGTGSTFDMPDLGNGEIQKGEEGIEGTALPASRIQSGRIEVLANSLFGSRNSRSKQNFIKSMRARQGTLSEMNSRLQGEVNAAVQQGSLNVARAQLKGRNSANTAELIESYMCRLLLNQSAYDAKVSEIEAKWINKPETQSRLEQGLDNEAIMAAEIDPHQAAAASNAGFSADIAESNAAIEESKAVTKEAELAQAKADFDKANHEAMVEYYEELKRRHNGKIPRKAMRQFRQHFGYGPVNEPSSGLNMGANATGSARRSSSVARRIITRGK